MAYVGPQTVGDGVSAAPRIAKDGSNVNLPDFLEYTYRGVVFTIDSDSVTLAAANTTKGALGTVKLINGFYNPPNSGKLACILRTVVSFTSGTPTGGLVYNFYQGGNLVTSAATGVIKSGYLNSGAGSSTMTPQVGVIIATTPASTPNMVQLGVIGGPAAIAAGVGLYSVIDEPRGSIIVPPGCVFGIAQVGASTALVQTSMTWLELPV